MIHIKQEEGEKIKRCIWAGGKDQTIHIDRKSPPLALALPLIPVTLEIVGAASAVGGRGQA